MTVSLTSLQKLMSLNLSTEQMAGVMEVLAVELAPLEAIRRSARDRQKRHHSRQTNVMAEREDNGVLTSGPSRVEGNIINLTSSNNHLEKNTPLSPHNPDPAGFAEFWAVYPKRDGAMERKGAVKAFRAALHRTDLTTILSGAQHFAEAMTARGKVHTQFIPQPRTWLNGDRWNDRYDTPAGAAESKEAQWLAVLQKHAAPSRS